MDQVQLEHAAPKGLARASREAISHSGVLPEQWRKETIRLQVANARGARPWHPHVLQQTSPAVMAGLVWREKLVRGHPTSLARAGVSGTKLAVRGFSRPRDHHRRVGTDAEDA